MASDAKETQKQENGSKVAFYHVIEEGKFPTTTQIEKVYPNVPSAWMDIYKLQAEALKKYLKGKKGYVYSRDETNGLMRHMEFLASKNMGVTVKDRWNPMDIVMVKKNEEKIIKEKMTKIATGKELPKDKLIKFNLYMKDLMIKKSLLPISLKAIKKGSKEALTEESNIKKTSKGVNFKLKRNTIKCDLDMVKPPLIDTGELSFNFFADDNEVKVQIRSKRYSIASTGPQIILAPIGRASGALLGSASTEAQDMFLKPLGLMRPPSPARDPQISVDGKFKENQIQFWIKHFEKIKNVRIDGTPVNYDMPLELKTKSGVKFEDIIRYALKNFKQDRNTLGRLTSKLFCLRWIDLFSQIQAKKKWPDFLSTLYYGAKKEFGDMNGPFLKIY